MLSTEETFFFPFLVNNSPMNILTTKLKNYQMRWRDFEIVLVRDFHLMESNQWSNRQDQKIISVSSILIDLTPYFFCDPPSRS